MSAGLLLFYEVMTDVPFLSAEHGEVILTLQLTRYIHSGHVNYLPSLLAEQHSFRTSWKMMKMCRALIFVTIFLTHNIEEQVVVRA